MKKIVSLALSLMMAVTATSAFAASEITVISREAGSGTRGAFIELTGVEAKNEAGEKVDHTYEEAIIQNGTAQVLTTVESDENAIGYISLGSLNEKVKAVTVEGVEATAENVKNGTYALARPFNIAVKEGLSETAQDFVNWLAGADAQAIVADKGYVAKEAEGTLPLRRPARLLWAVLPPLVP